MIPEESAEGHFILSRNFNSHRITRVKQSYINLNFGNCGTGHIMFAVFYMPCPFPLSFLIISF